MLNLKELGFDVGPSFIGYKHPVAYVVENRGFKLYKIAVS